MNTGFNCGTVTARKRASSNEYDGDNVPLTKRIALLSVDSSSTLDEECVQTSHQMLNNNYAPSCYTISQPVETLWQQASVATCDGPPCAGNEQPIGSLSSIHMSSQSDQDCASRSELNDICEKMGLPLLISDSKYCPELNSEANPEYYDINCVLFHAHLQRAQRRGILCPF